MQVTQNKSSRQLAPNDGLDWQTERIFIPAAEQGRPVASVGLSVRLRNVLERQRLQLFGNLHGLSYVEFAKYRNCGRKTLDELREIVRQLQHGTEVPKFSDSRPPCVDPNIILVSPSARDVALNELPLSARLEKVLQFRGYKRLGDLHGLDIRELLKIQNCGRKCIVELRNLVRSAATGEYSPEEAAEISGYARQVAAGIDAGLHRLPARDREIFGARLFGRNGNPRTLEDVGNEFGSHESGCARSSATA